MGVHDNKQHRFGVFGAVLLVFLIAAYGGLRFIYEEGYGLIYEISYALLLLIALAFVFDRLFVR